MTVFKHYARYYDLLYRGKDYASEARAVNDLLRGIGTEGGSILDLGCGTGRHAAEFARMGYSVHGMDRSEEMLAIAKTRSTALDPSLAGHLSFAKGDACEFRVERKFDAVTALFHVVSYQTGDAALSAIFATAARHLDKGGAFVFDVWHGPAVLHEKPEERERVMEDSVIRVCRRARPEMRDAENTVAVHYRIRITEKASGKTSEILETHCMRYLFAPELTDLLARAGLQLESAMELLSGKRPGRDTWSVCYLASKA